MRIIYQEGGAHTATAQTKKKEYTLFLIGWDICGVRKRQGGKHSETRGNF